MPATGPTGVGLKDTTLRLIHTADWQIGKVFRFVDDATMSLLQEARLEAIATIGGLAQAHGALTVLVAGDLYDHDGLSDRTLFQPIERMRALDAVTWHVIPGNHDADRPNGLWDRVARHGLPANVRLHRAPEPCPLAQDAHGEAGAWLLPAPLQRRQTLADPTLWMNEATTPDGTLRIGLAHGSVTRFGAADRSQGNYVDPARPKAARLDYLALGDWHGQREIGKRCWYAGTPEPDDFDQQEGAVLLVEIAGPGAAPSVQPLPTARHRWLRERETLHGAADVAVLDQRIRGLAPDPARLLVDLVVEGTLSLADRALFAQRIDRSLRAALCHLRLDDARLYLAPSPHDLDAIARTGFVRAAAARLKDLADERADPEREIAAEALMRLFLEHQKLAS
ncbi:MAG TPA: metallophosphoesterase [Geminicoccaceae bacterium]|nr:metallophosphoesterase [Geminicoccaceae bacterium]